MSASAPLVLRSVNKNTSLPSDVWPKGLREICMAAGVFEAHPARPADKSERQISQVHLRCCCCERQFDGCGFSDVEQQFDIGFWFGAGFYLWLELWARFAAGGCP